MTVQLPVEENRNPRIFCAPLRQIGFGWFAVPTSALCFRFQPSIFSVSAFVWARAAGGIVKPAITMMISGEAKKVLANR